MPLICVYASRAACCFAIRQQHHLDVVVRQHELADGGIEGEAVNPLANGDDKDDGA